MDLINALEAAARNPSKYPAMPETPLAHLPQRVPPPLFRVHKRATSAALQREEKEEKTRNIHRRFRQIFDGVTDGD
jgi:hypothetical protein